MTTSIIKKNIARSSIGGGDDKITFIGMAVELADVHRDMGEDWRSESLFL